MVFPLNGGSLYLLGLRDPWNTTAPPNAATVPIRSAPELQDVSLARAQWELHLYQPTYLPDELVLNQVTTNLTGTPLDHSGAIVNARSVSLIYENEAGKAVLVLAQSVCITEPLVEGQVSEVEVGDVLGRLYNRL